MTQRQAESAANVLISVAAAGAAFYVLRTPRLRRMLWDLTRNALASSGPWLLAETRRGWDQSSTASKPSAL